MDKKALIETGKAVVRVIIFAVVGYLSGVGVVSNLVTAFGGAKLTPEQQLALVGAITYMLSYIDKAIHDSSSRSNGLLPETKVT